jgi:hypothetical protein
MDLLNTLKAIAALGFVLGLLRGCCASMAAASVSRPGR